MSPAEEVANLLSALRAGSMTLDEVADQFRRRSWPRSGRPEAASMDESLNDPPANVPGSVDDVVAAYDRRELTREQYRVLVHAAADSINTERRKRAND